MEMATGTGIRHARQVGNVQINGLADCLDTKFKIITFTGASGSGKNSLISELMKLDPRFRMMKSVTTRAVRPDDQEYIHETPQDFADMDKRGEFLWTVFGHGHHYGTRHVDIHEALQREWPTLMHLVPSCVQTLQEHVGGQVASFFVSVSDTGILEARLRRRDKGKATSYYKERIVSCRQWEEKARENADLYLRFIDNTHKLETALDVVVSALRRPASPADLSS